MKERIRQEQDEERQRLESEMQRLVALEEEHRRKVQAKELEMGRIKEDLEKKWDRERKQVPSRNTPAFRVSFSCAYANLPLVNGRRHF